MSDSKGIDASKMQRELSMIQFYRENPIIAAADLLRVDLAVPQQAIINDMWFKNFVLVTAGRGSGKTYLNSVFACLWAMLYPGQKVGLLAPSFRQAKTIFAEVTARWQESPLLQEATEKKPIIASDRCYLEFKRAGFSRPSLIESLPLGDGCLQPHEMITLSDRFTTFGDEINVSEMDKDSQVFKNSGSIWSNGEFRGTDEKYYNGIRDTLKITTKKGYTIEGTLNHKIKVARGGEISWSRFDELEPGDRVLIDRSYRWHSAPNDVDLNSAYVLGLMIGDGCWTSKYKLSYATHDQELVNALEREFENVSHAADGEHFLVHGKSIKSSWTAKWGLGESTWTKDKTLPPNILNASRESMSACLRGLYDTDGHVQVSTAKGGTAVTVGFTNTSEKLVDQMHYILLHYGIVAYKTSRDRDAKWNTIYELLITGKDVNRFAECIGFGLKRKSNTLLEGIGNKVRNISSGDVIPGVIEEMIAFRQENRVPRGTDGHMLRHTTSVKLMKRKEASRKDVAYFLSIYSHLEDPLLDKLRGLLDDSVFYDEVGSIEKSRCPTFDMHVPDGHEYTASGFFSHNSKIRGARYYVILADEFAQIPKDIYKTVILPMGATVANPMENVRKIEKQKELISLGLATTDDFEDGRDNKVVMTSSAFFQFNHMYETKLNYEDLIRKGNDQYAVHTVSFRDMPEGFLSDANIINAHKDLSRLQFSMEYEAVWESDSAGMFKASLIEQCKSIATESVQLKGVSGAEYVLGVDPARASDAFAMCLIQLGPVNKVVAAWEFYNNAFPKMAQTVMEVCSNYNIVAVHMDAGAGGGGLAMKDLLFEEARWGASARLVDADDDEVSNASGRHILHMFQPGPRSNAEAVFASLNLMEKGVLSFPLRPMALGAGEKAHAQLDKEEGLYGTVENLLAQLMMIEVSETKSGVAHFDVPTGGGHAAQKKDLYTSFILASKKVYDMTIDEDDGSGILEVGLVTERQAYTGPTRPKLSDSLSVSQVPMNSWPFKNKFKPGL